MTYHAKVRAKGLEATGVTEELASQMFATMGQTTLAIVELAHVEQHNKSNGDRRIDLTIELLEPSRSEKMDDHLRELMRAMYADRRAKDGDTLPGTEGGGGRSLDDVLDAGEALLERNFDGEIDGTWDGSMEDEQANGDDPSYDKHPFTPSAEDAKRCAACNKTNRAAVHVTLSSVPEPATT